VPERRITMEIKKLIDWCNRERQSIEKTIEFWDSEKNYDMVQYEYARLDELVRIESIISELKGE
jgi:hypothetical protein